MSTILSAKGDKIPNSLLFRWKQKYLVWKSILDWFCSNSWHFKVFEFGIFCCKNVRVTATYGLKPAIKIEFCYWLRWRSVTFSPHSSLYLHSSISPVTTVFLIGLKWLAATIISCILIRAFREFLCSLARKKRRRWRCAPRNQRRLKRSKRSRKKQMSGVSRRRRRPQKQDMTKDGEKTEGWGGWGYFWLHHLYRLLQVLSFEAAKQQNPEEGNNQQIKSPQVQRCTVVNWLLPLQIKTGPTTRFS